MANTFAPNARGFNELRNSAAVQSDLLRRARAIAAKAESISNFANSEFTADVQPGKTRAHARASTNSRGAYWANFNKSGNKPLTAAIDAGRG